MSNYDEEFKELTIPEGINEKKSLMAEYALGILPVRPQQRPQQNEKRASQNTTDQPPVPVRILGEP